MRVFVIILNFNGSREVVECLNSLMNSNISRIDSNVVVVDNGSTDSSVGFIKELTGSRVKNRNSLINSSLIKNKSIKLIENGENLGFAAGCNVGIRHALENGAGAVLLLNQDTVVEKGFLMPLLENRADIVAPVIRFKRGGEWVYDFGGRVNWWLGRPEHIETPHLRGIMASTSFQPATSQERKIDYVSGCAMMVKKPVFDKIGLLDEKFFLYFEDIDFCLRAQKAGFKIAVEPGSMITHRLSEKKKKPLKQHFANLKSNFIFVNRYIPWYRRKIAYSYLWALFFKILWTQAFGGR